MPQPQYVFVLMDVCTAITGFVSWLVLFRRYTKVQTQSAVDDMLDQLNFRDESKHKEDSDSISVDRDSNGDLVVNDLMLIGDDDLEQNQTFDNF